MSMRRGIYAPGYQIEPPYTRAALREAEDLEAELRRKLRGEVRFDRGSRALYASDLSAYRQVPIGVVVPRDLDDVELTVAACHARGVPILGRGCGTSLSGQCCNVAVVIDFSKHLDRVLAVRPEERRAVVQPGVICDQLKAAVVPHGLCFAPDPATHAYCTLGGMIGNNSCGAHSVMGGRTADNVAELEILTYDGVRLRVGATSEAELAEIIRRGGRRGDIYARLRALRDRYAELVRARYPRIPRRVSGFNLDELLPERGFHVARALVGTESTCALVLSATLELMPNPRHRVLLVVGYPDAFVAADHVPELRALGPIALEAFHEHVLANMTEKGRRPPGAALLPDGHAWLLIELAGDSEAEARDKAERARAVVARDGRPHRLLTDAGEQAAMWHVRESGVGASRVPGVEDAWPSWEDSAVPPDRLGDYLRQLDALIRRHGYAYTLFGHFGDGCVHTRICFRLKTEQGVRDFRRFMEEATDLVVAFGGSLSGEHGDGQAKGELLPRMFGPELVEAFREFKAIWDPDGRMNPGKVVDPYPLDANLRVGPGHGHLPVATHFQFPEDGGSMERATERCFGIGKCRRLEAGTMCPSFRVTREEMHTTRGRARLLFEMLRGEVITDGWRSKAVREALDLCLACKGCKGDCPVSVDVATHKAEFLSHYYAGRLRPRSAYALGLVQRWVRLAALAPSVANFAMQAPGLSRLMKAAAGVAPERALPPLAGQTFRAWFRKRPRPAPRGRTVMLWPDTFNNYFRPSTARAAVEVLEWAGYDVVLPPSGLCCGRPLYDYGMLDLAARYLRRTLRALGPALDQGVPLVGLEPSCIAVFRDELPNLMPRDPRARRLSEQALVLGELLDRDGVALPTLRRKAVVHGHCHHRAVLDFDAEERVLRRLGLDLDVPDDGCCGMAGSFGYERDHYAVSQRIAEERVLPAVRAAADDALVIADGFSCRSQIDDGTARRPLHLAEVLHLAIHEGPDGPTGAHPERRYGDRHPVLSRRAAAGALAAALALGAAGWWYARRRRR